MRPWRRLSVMLGSLVFLVGGLRAGAAGDGPVGATAANAGPAKCRGLEVRNQSVLHRSLCRGMPIQGHRRSQEGVTTP